MSGLKSILTSNAIFTSFQLNSEQAQILCSIHGNMKSPFFHMAMSLSHSLKERSGLYATSYSLFGTANWLQIWDKEGSCEQPWNIIMSINNSHRHIWTFKDLILIILFSCPESQNCSYFEDLQNYQLHILKQDIKALNTVSGTNWQQMDYFGFISITQAF